MSTATEAAGLNILPADHTRNDFDFEYANGVVGPIRIGPTDTGFSVIPGAVWCRRHGWETEVVRRIAGRR